MTGVFLPGGGGGGGGVTDFRSLSDVNITGITDKQGVVFDSASGDMIPAALARLGGSYSDGDYAKFDVATGKFIPGAGSAGASLSAANTFTALQTFQVGVAITDAGSGNAARKFTLGPRTDTGFTYPVAVLRPVTNNKNMSLDIMPLGAPGENSTNGVTWIDVCDADVLASPAGTVGTARIAVWNDHVEFGSRAYNGATNKDVWLVANASAIPHLKIDATTGAMSIDSASAQTNTALTVANANVNSWTPLVIAGAQSAGTPNQVADMFAVYNKIGGTKLWSISAAGRPEWPTAGVQTTVGAAGGASAMPTPTGYLKIRVNGVDMVIPYCAAS